MADTDLTYGKLACQHETEEWVILGAVPGAADAFDVEHRAGLICGWWRGRPGQVDHILVVPPSFAGSVAEALRSVEPQLADRGMPVAVRVLDTERTAPERKAIERLGYRWSGTQPLMAAELNQIETRAGGDPAAHVSRVATEQEHEAVLDIIDRVYGGPRVLTRFFNPFGRVQIYAAHDDGRPVASATLRSSSGIAGIASVATLPEHRHRGLAQAVIGSILTDESAKGTPLATLRTDDELIGLYERFGFREVGRVARYRRQSA